MLTSYANAAKRVLDKWPGMTMGVTQLRPHSVGTIHIKSPDALVGPAIGQAFVERHRPGMHGAQQADTPPLAQHVVQDMSLGTQVQTYADWLGFARRNGPTIYHPSGTCRMGEDATAVVDLRLRVCAWWMRL